MMKTSHPRRLLVGIALVLLSALGGCASVAQAKAPAHRHAHSAHRNGRTHFVDYQGAQWATVGATVDPTRGQAPYYSDHGGMSFAELLEAGANAGLRPDATQVLGLPRASRYGMAMETRILVRLPGSDRVFSIWKNDVGSGQPGQPYYKVDLHPGIARALGVSPTAFKGSIQIAVPPTVPTAVAALAAAQAPASTASAADTATGDVTALQPFAPLSGGTEPLLP